MKKELKGLEEPNTVVHCDTEEKANLVLKIAKEADYNWSSGDDFSNNKYTGHKENTCYCFKNGTYSYKDYFVRKGYKIITAEEFIKANIIEVGDTVRCSDVMAVCADGWEAGLEYVVTDINEYETGNVYFGGWCGSGVYAQDVELVKKAKATPTAKQQQPLVNTALPSKEDVYVVLDTPEKVRQFYDVLVQANEPMYYTSREYWADGVVKSFSEAYYLDGEWMVCGDKARRGRTKVSVEQLAEILNVKSDQDVKQSEIMQNKETVTFKVGDRVRIVRAFEDEREGVSMRKEMHTLIGKEGVVVALGSKSNTVTVNVPNTIDGQWTWFTDCLELITEPQTTQTIIPSRKVSRESLAVIYKQVCSGWQSRITSLLDKTDPFSNEVEVPEDLVKRAHQEANNEQLKWLRLHLPAPKKVETKELVFYANLTDNGGSYKYKSEQDAISHAKHNGTLIATAVKCTGSYTVEVEDESYSVELPW